MKLTVVILNWNGINDTLACLASLQNVDIVVVDNGSSDDSVAAIAQQFPGVVLLETGKNLGYAGGNNVGIEYALKLGADLVLLLNNDTIVDRHFIAALLKSAQEHKNVGIFGAYPLRLSDPEKLDHLGGRWNSQKASFDLIGLGADKGFKTDQPLDYVCGCSILVRKEVFEAIGLLEPTFFLFWEEADFCMRAKKAGFDIGISYEATLLHKVSASFVGGAPHKTYFWWRGRCLWMERNCSKEEKERLYQTVVLPELRHLLKLRILKSCQFLLLRLLQKKNLSQKKGKLLQYRAALEGYRDFNKASFGSGPSWLFKME
ncbi:MAG TPA: glycosyltransferase family 2 protein [Rhabdochlamydiaceae bacterium]|nr:glycosyltransferase family 2 protein [Rhabdochlamydiaceae bacterium]